jgi:hypothetical protein
MHSTSCLHGLCRFTPGHRQCVRLPSITYLGIGNPRFKEEPDDEAIPDYFYTPITLLGGEPAATVQLRFDLTTHRFAREE